MDGHIYAQPVMMQLGSFQFGISTAAYQELTRSTKFRWPGHDLFGQAPALQFTGRESETISLQGVVYAEWRGGQGQVNALRAMAATGQPHLMVDGLGGIMGRWVIEGVDEKQSVFAAFGLPRKQEFTLQLKRFGDAESENVGLAFANGIASSLGGGIAANAGPAAGLLSSSAAGMAGQAFAGLNAAAQQIQTVGAAALQALGPVRQAVTLANNIKLTAQNAGSVIARMGNITDLAGAEAALGSIMRVAGGAAATATGASNLLKRVGVTLAADGEAAPVLAAARAGLLQVNRLALTATTIRSNADAIMRVFRT